jgi:RNA recognition motif-containing protein
MGKGTRRCAFKGIEHRNISGESAGCYCSIWAVDYLLVQIESTVLMGECSMNMYIGNLAYDVTENDLRNAFSEFGEVSSVKIITDKFSGRPKGFGFVEMPDNSEADQAIKALNGKVFNGRSIKVNQAEPRGKRPRRRRRY